MRKTLNEGCFCGCNSTDLHPHEPYGGRNRQLSIKYGMVLAIDSKEHSYVHDNPKCPLDLEMKAYVRKHFEDTYPELDFIEIFK